MDQQGQGDGLSRNDNSAPTRLMRTRLMEEDDHMLWQQLTTM